jgi:hypothetical protein
MTKRKFSDIFTADAIAKTFGIPSLEDVAESTWEYVADAGHYASNEALKEGGTEQEAEKAREKAEEVAGSAIYNTWKSSFEDALSSGFAEYADLDIKPLAKEEWRYKVSPKTSWERSAVKLIDIINGVGYFYFRDLKDFLRSGPYTARTAVLGHIHWIRSAPAVYDASIARRYERNWESASRSL